MEIEEIFIGFPYPEKWQEEKKVQAKDSVERKLYGEDSVTITTTISPNSQISMKI